MGNHNYGPVRETNPVIEYFEKLAAGAMTLGVLGYGLATLNCSTPEYTQPSNNPTPNTEQVGRAELSDLLGHYNDAAEPNYENIPGYKSVLDPLSVPSVDSVQMYGDL